MRENKKIFKLTNWLIRKFSNEELMEEFLGDLEEIFEDRITTKGYVHAYFMHWVDAIHLVIGFASFRKFKTQNNNTMMFNNMMKIAWRSAVRHKQFSLLNLLGLTLGIATCIILGLYVHDEMTYDRFHTKSDRIYRVNQPFIWNNWDLQFASTGPNVAIALREDAPEFEEVTRLLNLGTQTVRRQTSKGLSTINSESKFFVAEDNFFDVFSFKFLEGDAQTALKDPMSAVVTQETAQRYFGYEEAMGQSLEVKQSDGSWKTYVVRGILKDIPAQSHLQFDLLFSLSSYADLMDKYDWKWIWTAFSTYGLVAEGTDINALRDKIQAIPPKWAPLTTERIFNQSYEDYTAGKQWTLYLQPLREIYLSESPDFHRFGPTGNPEFVKIFGVIGLLVLLLSCINFMNLSTARSANRSKEVGLRKVLGSERGLLVKQFILESILFVMLGTAFALLTVQLTINGFNNIAEKEISLMLYLLNPWFALLLVLFVIVLGTVSGSYPAFYLSSFEPIDTLKGKVRAGFRSKSIRNGLVIFQFTISIGLIICTFFVQRQLAYTSALDLGFDKNNVLQIHNIEQLGKNGEVLKNKMEAIPALGKIGKSYSIPPNVWDGERYRGPEADDQIFDMSNFRADGDFVDVMGFKIITGRNFDESRPNDKYGTIINEKAVQAFGWSAEEAIGKYIVCTSDNEQRLEVIGVSKDFNFNSVRQNIEPLVIYHYNNDRSWNYGRGNAFLSARLNSQAVANSNDIQLLIEGVQNEMLAMDPSITFKYSFMDKSFENAFRFEQQMGLVLNIFTLMALIIACLGLFGLAAFSAEQRLKELSIRKILGAKVSQLLFLFSTEFSKLIAISALIASPIAYLLMDNWLNDFPYRTPLDLWVFLIAGVCASIIAILTVGYQSLRAAYKNPVDTLKDE